MAARSLGHTVNTNTIYTRTPVHTAHGIICTTLLYSSLKLFVRHFSMRLLLASAAKRHDTAYIHSTYLYFPLYFFSFVRSYIFFSLFFLAFRYYRANAVRYPTPPCEGVCALNHYCAITRVDYHEFRHCLESAASALASHGTRALPCIPIAAHIALILAICAVVKYRHHCELLIEYLYFRLVDGLVNILLAKCVITFLVDFLHKLRFKRLNRIVASVGPSAPPQPAMLAMPAPAQTTTSIIPSSSSATLCALVTVPAPDNSYSRSIYTKSTVFVHEKCNGEEVRLKMPLEPKSNRRRRR